MDWDLKLRENFKELYIFSEERINILKFCDPSGFFFLLKIGI